jgi:hypothetical protein
MMADFLQRFPSVVAAVEEGGVLGLREVEQFGDGESHGGRLGKTRALATEKASVLLRNGVGRFWDSRLWRWKNIFSRNRRS